MSLECQALKTISDLEEQIAYLTKVNQRIAQQDVSGKDDLVWVMRDELKVLSGINQAGGIKKYKEKLSMEILESLGKTNDPK